MSNSTSRPRASAASTGARRAVAIAEHLRPFEQIGLPHHSVEAGVVDEMVVLACDLARPLLARRHRDREIDHRIDREQLARQRRLAGARG
jgi:hypothetical protein